MLQYSSSHPSHSPEPIAKTCKNPWFLPFSQEKQLISVSPGQSGGGSSQGQFHRLRAAGPSRSSAQKWPMNPLNSMGIWLVGGLEHLDDFSIYWE